MEAYTAFAKVYDRLMQDVPYKKWADALEYIIDTFGISKPCRDAEDILESERNLVLDLGCGTGVMTRLMYEKGYDMIGIDISQEMLDEAYSENDGREILYICQDMCELDLYSTIGTVYSTCDSINYLIEDEDIKECFEGVEKFLYPGGLFIFDFNTLHKYRDVIGNRTIAENNEDCSFIWDNYFDEEENVNECDLTLFIKESAGGDGAENDPECEAALYRKENEVHCQRGYTIEEIRQYLTEAGFDVIGMIDESTLDMDDRRMRIDSIMSGNHEYEADDPSERVIAVARKRAD